MVIPAVLAVWVFIYAFQSYDTLNMTGRIFYGVFYGLCAGIGWELSLVLLYMLGFYIFTAEGQKKWDKWEHDREMRKLRRKIGTDK